MKKIFYSLAFFLSATALAAGKSNNVELKLSSPPSVQAGKVALAFRLVDGQGKSLGDKELKISHEEKLHLLAYDPGLGEFRHEHPVFREGSWQTELDLPVNGRYFVWAQGLSAAGEFTAGTRLEVKGGKPASPAPSLREKREGEDSGSVVTLSNETLRAGKDAMLTLRFSRTDGKAAKLTPYLGAFAHVVATPTNGETLLHVHPMNGKKPNEGMLHVGFPAPGAYRLWVQFREGGQLKTVPLAVVVGK